MEPRDVARVAELEAASFTAPWREGTFHRLVGRPLAELWVVEEEGRVVGYAVLWCVLDQGELANIAIAPEARGRGLGGALLDHVLAEARRRGMRTLFLEVRESNRAARAMYDARGFLEVGVRPGYYSSPSEDARVLKLPL
jgi:ribosomal-protein-alanine N-acetyltransferase